MGAEGLAGEKNDRLFFNEKCLTGLRDEVCSLNRNACFRMKGTGKG